MKIENFTVTCPDQVKLKGKLIMPKHPKAVIQLNTGTAAKKEFYQPFSEYLAEAGFVVALWDYRGNGESAPESLKGCDYRYQDYGRIDMPSIKKYLRQRFPELPYMIIGHSTGGQQVGFMEELDDVQGLLAITVSTGYIPNMPLSDRLKSNFFFYLFGPFSQLLWGYAANKRLGIMEDLPKNVWQEWREWCEKEDYFFDPKIYGKKVPEGNFRKLSFPIHVLWVSDDPIANEQNVKNLWRHFRSSAGITLEEINTQEIQEKEVGHFGFFRRKMKEKLWPKALDILNGFLEKGQAEKLNSLASK